MCTKNKSYSTIILSIFLLTFAINQTDADHHNHTTSFSEIVESWAEKIGSELKTLADSLIKTNELKEEYEQNVQLEKADNSLVIAEIAEKISRMFKQRIKAVKCVAEKAESAVENVDYNRTENHDVAYYSSKYSPKNGARSSDGKNEIICAVQDNAHLYKNMELERNSDFLDIEINTKHSSVHIPNTVYVTDESPATRRTINWTKALDEIFQENYRADPSLDWQYFGSNTGVFRHYPARSWETRGKVDHYDCRKQQWYIEASTGPKEVIILIDNSDEMSTFAQEHVEKVLSSILDTFSSHDKLNVFLYSEGIKSSVECFNDVLVPGAREYIDVFRSALENVEFNGDGDIVKAYKYSFELLKRYREMRNSSGLGSDRSQAIILITSEIDEDLSKVFNKFNKIEYENVTNVPVRLFTYLLNDDELSDIDDRKTSACANRGYFSHIQREEDIQQEVFKYLDAFARPLVLDRSEHPISWTTTYHEELDTKNSTRSWITVSVPVFDKRPENFTVDNTELLGVAGTDILVEDINELLQPYLLGVNGYAFLVDNYGYVVTHPELHLMEHEILKNHLQCVDITEIESLTENSNTLVEEIRKNLLSGKGSELLNVSNQYKYENKNRAVYENYDYHFTPIPDTPFTLAIAVPSEYGSGVSKINLTESGNELNASDYFASQNWDIHPDWVYCKYRISKGHEFSTPKDELRSFLSKLEDPSWEWSEQYEIDDKGSCDRKAHEDDSYYCNEKLLKLLIFDAKITNETYNAEITSEGEDNHLIHTYKASIHFTSTSSGLTRWWRISNNKSENKSVPELFLSRGVDEAWYKSAVIQHEIDPDSLFYSVSLNEDDNNDDDGITVSQALFLSNEEYKVPVAVSGFQLSLNALKQRFLKITNQDETVNGTDVTVNALNCSHPLIDCYVIDNNGYIVISEIENSTGKFFGQIEGEILLSLVEKNIFKEIRFNDYNALCIYETVEESDAMTLITPFRIARLTAEWLIAQLFLYLAHINIWVQSIPFENVVHKRNKNYENCRETDAIDDQEGDDEDDNENQHHTSRACTKMTTLYILQQNLFLDDKLKADELRQRPFWLKRIPHSNLLLVVISNQFAEKLSVQAPSTQEVHYLQDYPCYKKLQNTTGKYERAFTSNPFETNATFCRSIGASPKLEIITTVLSMLLFILFFLNFD